MTRFPDPAPGSIRRWAILVIGSLNFVISMFYRVSTAMISPALVRDLGLTSGDLGDLSAAFYYAFAAGQIPVGYALDRIGARKTILVLSFAAIGGAVLFSVGQTPTQLIIARAILGIGMSGNFMVLLTLVAAWFPVDRFASLSGTVVSIGVVGNLLAATPLAVLEAWIGWRTSFLLFAAINALVVVVFLVVVRDRPGGRSADSFKPGSLIAGLGRLLGMYSFWAISLSSFVRYGYFAALQSLWIAPFLIFGLGLGEIPAGNVVFVMGIGYMVGMPLTGILSDRVVRSRKYVVLTNMLAFTVLTALFIWWSASIAQWVLFVLFFLFGFTSASGQILYAHMKELLPPAMIAQAMTSVNLFTILGVGIMTHLLGSVLGGDPSSLHGPEAFRSLWYLGAVTLSLVCILYSFVPDSKALALDDN